ncbi:hypothetical protein Gohar_021481 [Gossypium harknessii]|uniref:Uncharacterized protein n=1 Tax=Gossypium harknessii TaxID=34285 RepID=A0A7J9IED4_9ROSI|nr:hypothetical protein [Gossypium harknessii]
MASSSSFNENKSKNGRNGQRTGKKPKGQARERDIGDMLIKIAQQNGWRSPNPPPDMFVRLPPPGETKEEDNITIMMMEI